MYESYFGLRENPFSLRPDPDYYFLHPSLRLVVAQLEYALLSQGAGIVLISGEAGVGKTTLIRRLMSLARPELSMGLMFQGEASWVNTLRWMSLAFDLPTKSLDEVALFEQLLVHWGQEASYGRRCVLVVDEAHLLSDEQLTRLRILGNVNADDVDLLQLVLVGQSELRHRLSAPPWEAMRQRIVADVSLGALSEAEVGSFIAHRLSAAGCQEALFSEDAVRLITRASGGIPRLINGLCDTSLLFAFAESCSQVNDVIVNAVIRDRMDGAMALARIETKSASK